MFIYWNRYVHSSINFFCCSIGQVGPFLKSGYPEIWEQLHMVLPTNVKSNKNSSNADQAGFKTAGLRGGEMEEDYNWKVLNMKRIAQYINCYIVSRN